MMRFTDSVCIVTGSSRGIGKETARAFAKEGAKVILNCGKSREEAEAALKEIRDDGGIVELVQADISTSEGADHLISETLNLYGKVDVLVNNAGIHNPKPFFELQQNDWEETFRVNVGSILLMSQRAAKVMIDQKYGKIVNISSVRGLYHCGRVDNIDYSASKAAVVNLTKTLAKQLAPYIRVNSVAPGPTETELIKDWDEEVRKCAIEESYMKRLMEPAEIARAVLFLSSRESDAITGEILLVDGGYSLK